ncbi:adenosylcobalamin/alpha-ribazole phosphatase [Shimwellia pseudoproteus]|uniref:adenosylcobalamin/alpha-ribazole phosphatase n=1 Tax=Shimwellia pseudoproteus TaxID=570012 RepID=UPI0018EB3F4D|nr:adenosylcobalamin/alpha-ribazole phosphatase [Shimwellia pseudoproteus]MBJ3814547.1 adenosylcobalamin/alpha-ribazole phosphatase [Shimwellia pseudoproteus]
MNLWLIRHGETEANVAGLYSGISETPLTPRGEQQASALRALLAPIPFDRVITSELSRAGATARLALAGRDLTMQRNGQLNEMNFGHWEMRHHRDLIAEGSTEYQAWCDDWQHVIPPGGEGFQAFSQRIQQCVEALKAESQQHTARHILLVSHKGVFGLLLAHLLGLPPAAMWRFAIEQGCWSRVELHGDYAVLRTLNSQCPASA